jgi:hypothetical protein
LLRLRLRALIRFVGILTDVLGLRDYVGFGKVLGLHQATQKLLTVVDETQKSATELLAIYDKMVKEERAIRQAAFSVGLHFDPIFQKLSESNRNAAQESSPRGFRER